MCLGFLKLSGFVLFSLNLGKVWSLFLQIFFLSFLSPSLRDSNYMYIWRLGVLSLLSVLPWFKKILYSLCLILDSFYYYFSSLLFFCEVWSAIKSIQCILYLWCWSFYLYKFYFSLPFLFLSFFLFLCLPFFFSPTPSLPPFLSSFLPFLSLRSMFNLYSSFLNM